MAISTSSEHWNSIYGTKDTSGVSWYQEVPETSLLFLEQTKLPGTARIIDIGGGDSRLADCLLAAGFSDITVLDISEKALALARNRLGSHSGRIKWITADAARFHSNKQYDFWHDRATFHFLVNKKDTDDYLKSTAKSIRSGGFLVIGTFSDRGPEKCSGLPVRRYSEKSLEEHFIPYFRMIEAKTVDHETPGGSTQNFLWGCFKRL